MNLSALWLELLRRNRLLAIAGGAVMLLFVILLLISVFDATQILGINRWIKPMKFSLSITIYLWTIGWLLSYLETVPNRVRFVTWGIVVTMIVELIAIVGQAARGEMSHFNQRTAFDAAVFGVMGIMILSNTLLLVYTLILFHTTPVSLPAASLWGIRLGLLLFIVFSLEGALMVARLQHGVSVTDGGPGLPFVNWSTRGGDLRVAHFVGLHALQLVPLTGFLLDKLKPRLSLVSPLAGTIGFAVIYTVIAVWLFVRAMQGQPLLAAN